MARKSLAEFLASKNGRTFAVLLIPGAYVLGFILWAYYAATEGLGFLPLTSPRYLTAGATLAVYGTLALWLPIRLLKKEHRRKKGRAIALVLLVTVGNLLAILLFLGLGASLEVFSLDQADAWILVALPVATAVLVTITQLLGLLSVGLGQSFDWAWESILKRRVQRFKRPETWPFFPVYQVVWPLLLFVAAGLLLLPAMESELGGAKPRHAELELIAPGFSPSTLEALGVPANRSTNATTVSVTVTVMFYDSSSMLVRIAPNDWSAYDPLYELDRDWISVIHWLD